VVSGPWSVAVVCGLLSVVGCPSSVVRSPLSVSLLSVAISQWPIDGLFLLSLIRVNLCSFVADQPFCNIIDTEPTRLNRKWIAMQGKIDFIFARTIVRVKLRTVIPARADQAPQYCGK